MVQGVRSYLVLGIGSALAMPAWIVGFSLLGVGSLARDAGHPAGSAVLSTLLVWAAPAQVILYGSIAAGTALPVIAVAVALSAVRLMPMTVSLMPYVRRPGQGLLAQAFVAHFVTVTAWVDAMRRLPDMEPIGRLPYFLGFAGSCLAVSTGMTLAGYYLAGALPLPLAIGLVSVTPIYFMVSLAAGAKLLADWAAIVLGFLLLPLATEALGRNFDLLAAGLAGGTAAYLIGRRRKAANA
jgi:predicted branched-subunit amino acid permease